MDISGINPNIYQQLNISKQDKVTTTSFEDALKKAEEEQDDKALREACREFEEYFVNQMFSEMRKTVHGGSLIPKSQGEKIFEDMLYEEYSKEIAKEQGIGIAQMMFEQLSNTGTVNQVKSGLK
ncbi:rod-binding protein [Vallitalea pronyensis]|uniref:Rod-binding protein n=1 Tax=Vallitalea pronyensis TaxID=1348613 RepID=A0A8J8MH85_9FIRM|nr:rod-binding protein [Vallitalea pronyensis]QUI21442.1 rod-binding protein [Vallitalea pronyensis]